MNPPFLVSGMRSQLEKVDNYKQSLSNGRCYFPGLVNFWGCRVSQFRCPFSHFEFPLGGFQKCLSAAIFRVERRNRWSRSNFKYFLSIREGLESGKGENPAPNREIGWDVKFGDNFGFAGKRQSTDLAYFF